MNGCISLVLGQDGEARVKSKEKRPTVLVVVTHLGLLAGGVAVAGNLDGLLGDLHVLVVNRTLGGRVDGGVVNTASRLLVVGRVAGTVNGGTGYVDLLAVVGLEARAILALGNVDGGAVVVVVRVAVGLNVSLGVGRRSVRGPRGCRVSQAVDVEERFTTEKKGHKTATALASSKDARVY